MDDANLTSEKLAPVVGRLLNDQTAVPFEWTCEALVAESVNPVTAGLYRVIGTARAASGQTGPWRVVLKVVTCPDLSGTPLENGYATDPQDWNYWKREALALRCGVLDRFTTPLRAVRCLGTEDLDESTSWIWLEDLDTSAQPSGGSFAELSETAYDLGAFAAQAVDDVSEVDALPWSAHAYLRGWVRTGRAMGVDHAIAHDGCWAHPLIRNRLPTSARDALKRLMAADESLFSRLNALPRTVTHGDFHRSNLFREPGTEGHRCVALDWGFFGTGPIGEDLGHYIGMNLFRGDVQPIDAANHAQHATQAYLRGLRAHGWEGAAEDIEFASVTSGALRTLSYAVAHVAALCPEFGDPHPWPEELAAADARGVDAAMSTWCDMFRFLTSWAERATSSA